MTSRNLTELNVLMAGRLLVGVEPENGAAYFIMENLELNNNAVVIYISRQDFDRICTAFTDSTTLKIGVDSNYDLAATPRPK
jgi:tRNA1(Val) A37 N6-methylase TrmN6